VLSEQNSCCRRKQQAKKSHPGFQSANLTVFLTNNDFLPTMDAEFEVHCIPFSMTVCPSAVATGFFQRDKTVVDSPASTHQNLEEMSPSDPGQT
jgi:hypothetical protein